MPLDGDATGVALGVDHGHARRPDREVVDVRAAALHASVVEQDDVMPGSPALELSSELGFSFGAARPCLLVLRPRADGEAHASLWITRNQSALWPFFSQG